MTGNQHLIWLPVALLAGLVLGRLGPGTEIREKDQQIADLEKQVRKARQNDAQIAGISRMLRMPDETSEALSRSDSDDDATNGWSGATHRKKNQAEEDEDGSPDERRERPDMTEQIERATEIWDMRKDMARANFVSRVEMNDEQEEQFEVILAAMNLRLAPIFEAWAEDLQNGNTLVAESGTRYLHEITGAVNLVYEEMDRSMPEDWREKSGDQFNAGDFIDPAIFAPLVQVEDRLNQWGPRE